MSRADLRRLVPKWDKAYRIINSSFPPVSVFEDTVNPDDLDIAYAIEALTNDRLREEVGSLARVPPHDRVSGPGSTPVMAAFTHIGRLSRFSDGTYGVYYCANSIDAAIAETRFHQERFWRATRQASIEITMRSYVNHVVREMIDVRRLTNLHDPDPLSYATTQVFARTHRQTGAWGLLYNSVRLADHECVAVFRPPAVSLPVQGQHFRYIWDGKSQTISCVLQISEVIAPQ